MLADLRVDTPLFGTVLSGVYVGIALGAARTCATLPSATCSGCAHAADRGHPRGANLRSAQRKSISWNAGR